MIPANTVIAYRNAVKKVLDGLDEESTLRAVIMSQGGAETFLGAEGTFTGENSDIGWQEVADVMNAIDRIRAAIAATPGTDTILNKLRA